jgi:hypothetical protein
VTGITFRAHLSKGALKGCQSIVPRGDGTFHAIQLPILGKELPLQLDGTAFEGDGALHQSTSRDQRHSKEASPDKH